MQASDQPICMGIPEYRGFNTINTTLYELVEVISKEINPDEDRLVPAIVSDLFDKGLIRLTDSI